MTESKKRLGKEERRSNLTGRSWQLLKSRTGSGMGMHGDCCLWALWPVCHFNYLWKADSRAINIHLSLSHHTISCPASAASLSKDVWAAFEDPPFQLFLPIYANYTLLFSILALHSRIIFSILQVSLNCLIFLGQLLTSYTCNLINLSNTTNWNKESVFQIRPSFTCQEL